MLRRRISAPVVTASGPIYATWTDLTKLTAENNGLTKTSAIAWDAAGRTVETFSTGGGIKLEVPAAERFMLQLSDSTIATGTNYTQTSGPFSIYIQGLFRTYYQSTLLASPSTITAGDIIEIRENGGSVEALKNDVVIYTFSQTPFSSFCGRMAVSHPDEIPNIELTGGVWS